MKNNILGTEKISTLFAKFTIPAIIAMLITGTQSMVDGIFLGTFVGPHAMTSITLAQPFIQVIIGTSMVICMGASSLIGRKLGEKKVKLSQNAFQTSFRTLLATSLIILVLGVAFGKNISLLLGADVTLLDNVASYIIITACFAPAMSLMFFFGFINRLMERPDLYLKASIFALTLNIGLDYLLIKVLGTGVTGAAFATGISYVGALLVVVTPFLKKKNLLTIFKGKFSSYMIIPMVYNGSSEAITSVAIGFTIYLFNITLMGLVGVDGVTAFTAINHIAQLGILLMFGLSDGIGVIISFNYGNGDIKRIKAILKLALKITSLIGIVLFLILTIGAPYLINLFIKNNQTISDMASRGAKIYALSFLMSGFNVIISGYFTYIGKAKESVIIAACRGIIFIGIGIFILPQVFQITGVWLTVPFAELFTFIISIFLLKKSFK